MFNKFLRGVKHSKAPQKDNITIDVNPDHQDDIETIEDPMNRVILNSVLTKTQKNMRRITERAAKDHLIENISKFEDELASFNRSLKTKLDSINRSIYDYKLEQPTIPLIPLGSI